jgi:ABC-type enterochelin transport system substrate-binding protein
MNKEIEADQSVILEESDTKQIFDNGFVANVEAPQRKQTRWRKYWKTIAAAVRIHMCV